MKRTTLKASRVITTILYSMSEFEMRQRMKKMERKDLMTLLAFYLLEEQGIKVTTEKQIQEVIEQNYMREVAREDLMVEIINSRSRLGIA